MHIEELDVHRSKEIQIRFHVSNLCAKVLASKNLDDEQIQELFQKPELADPFSANGMQEVVNRIYQAKMNNEKVMVCGDYDADGSGDADDQSRGRCDYRRSKEQSVRSGV